ncbi:MAG: glycosyltransferase [Gemmataceae bacterium]|jgi:glycosyltransferase involved in cell wall biosynthesis|nr:glycosyltransferase [Gemmataceae bacterium]
MSPPLISIVLATRDYGRFLGQAIDSVRGQTWTNWELIIIDDGSQDHTPSLVQDYLRIDDRIRYFRTEGLGQPRAKNLGIGYCTGKYIAFIDGDDCWKPTKLEKQISLFRSDSIGVVYCQRELINEDGSPRITPEYSCYRGRVLEQMVIQNFVPFSSAVVRKDIFDHIGKFDESIGVAIDYDLWLRVAAHYQFDYVPEPLILYRTGHTNLSSKVRDRILVALSILKRAIRRNPRLPSVRESTASTYRTMAYITRKAGEPIHAIRWIVWAALLDRKWVQSTRTLLRLLWEFCWFSKANPKDINSSINR